MSLRTVLASDGDAERTRSLAMRAPVLLLDSTVSEDWLAVDVGAVPVLLRRMSARISAVLYVFESVGPCAVDGGESPSVPPDDSSFIAGVTDVPRTTPSPRCGGEGFALVLCRNVGTGLTNAVDLGLVVPSDIRTGAGFTGGDTLRCLGLLVAVASAVG